jgi:hypothetical protein
VDHEQYVEFDFDDLVDEAIADSDLEMIELVEGDDRRIQPMRYETADVTEDAPTWLGRTVVCCSCGCAS